jgi:hypothetical protein
VGAESEAQRSEKTAWRDPMPMRPVADSPLATEKIIIWNSGGPSWHHYSAGPLPDGAVGADWRVQRMSSLFAITSQKITILWLIINL